MSRKLPLAVLATLVIMGAVLAYGVYLFGMNVVIQQLTQPPYAHDSWVYIGAITMVVFAITYHFVPNGVMMVKDELEGPTTMELYRRAPRWKKSFTKSMICWGLALCTGILWLAFSALSGSSLTIMFLVFSVLFAIFGVLFIGTGLIFRLAGR